MDRRRLGGGQRQTACVSVLGRDTPALPPRWEATVWQKRMAHRPLAPPTKERTTPGELLRARTQGPVFSDDNPKCPVDAYCRPRKVKAQIAIKSNFSGPATPTLVRTRILACCVRHSVPRMPQRVACGRGHLGKVHAGFTLTTGQSSLSRTPPPLPAELC